MMKAIPVTKTEPHWFSDLLICLECEDECLTEIGSLIKYAACHVEYLICHNAHILM